MRARRVNVSTLKWAEAHDSLSLINLRPKEESDVQDKNNNFYNIIIIKLKFYIKILVLVGTFHKTCESMYGVFRVF